MNAPTEEGHFVVVYRWNSATVAPVAAARDALGSALAAVGVQGEAQEDAELIVSELVANANEHACGPYEVILRWARNNWVCEVMDQDTQIPQFTSLWSADPFIATEDRRGGGLDALVALLTERGRGLPIVDYLAQGAWGYRRSGEVKIAWFVVPKIRT